MAQHSSGLLQGCTCADAAMIVFPVEREQERQGQQGAEWQEQVIGGGARNVGVLVASSRQQD